MLIEIPLWDLIPLYRWASLGKVIGGLVHNLNGPLQNIGLDIEMTKHLLSNTKPLGETELKTVLTRIRRMGEEFERIDQLIKTAAVRASQDDDYFNFLHMNEFIKQEFDFCRNNLYFKHNVQTEFKFQKNLPTLRNLPKDLIMALSAFIHTFVDELEDRKIKRLFIKTSMNTNLKITLETKDGHLSDQFMDQLDREINDSPALSMDDHKIDILFPLIIFHKTGVLASGKKSSTGSKISLQIPMHNPPA
ncbi:MAG: hypothetical protein JW932_19595 [Deltaproteobacteria bacterium]|nr:hypothetical protein [Deltaproteobacteria bacterium]